MHNSERRFHVTLSNLAHKDVKICIETAKRSFFTKESDEAFSRNIETFKENLLFLVDLNEELPIKYEYSLSLQGFALSASNSIRKAVKFTSR